MDELDRIKRQTYLLHQGEDGIWDIMGGLFLLLAGLNLMTDFPAFIVFYIALVPMLARGLKKRYVYPRIGVAVFEPAPVKKTTVKIMVLTLFTAMMTAVMFVLFLHVLPLGQDFIMLLGLLLGLLAGLSVVFGGLLRDRRLYMAALGLGLIALALQLLKSLWLGIALVIPIVILFIALLMWVVKNGSLRRTREIFERPSVVTHRFLVGFGALVVAFCLVSFASPHMGQVALDWAGQHLRFLFGVAFTALSVCLGIAYLKPRYFAYAAVIFAFIALPGMVAALDPYRHWLMLLAAVVIMLSGTLFLRRFVHRYPVLEDNDE